MPVVKKSGAGGRVKIGANYPVIRAWNVTIEVDFVETTASDNFDTTSGKTWKSQVKGVYQASGSVEGVYDFDPTTGTDTSVIQALYSNTPVAIDLDVDRTTTFGYGDFDLENIEVSLEITGEVGFTADISSNGVFTLGARPGP